MLRVVAELANLAALCALYGRSRACDATQLQIERSHIASTDTGRQTLQLLIDVSTQ